MCRIFSCDAGQWQLLEHKGEQLIHSQLFCSQTAILLFTSSTVFWK